MKNTRCIESSVNSRVACSLYLGCAISSTSKSSVVLQGFLTRGFSGFVLHLGKCGMAVARRAVCSFIPTFGPVQVEEGTAFHPQMKGEIGGYGWYEVAQLPDQIQGVKYADASGKRINFYKVRPGAFGAVECCLLSTHADACGG